MDAENLGSHNCCNWEAVEDVNESLPYLDIASPFAFVVEAIYSRDICAFVIPPEKKEVLGMLDLVAEKKKDRLQTLFATINIVAKEQVICIWGKTTHLEKTNEVRILAMDIADNLYWWGKLDQGWLTEEDFACHLAECSDFGILETDRL